MYTGAREVGVVRLITTGSAGTCGGGEEREGERKGEREREREGGRERERERERGRKKREK